MLKGFFDKVMIPGFGYVKDEAGMLVPVLDIPETLVVTTSEAPTEVFTSYFEATSSPSSWAQSGCTAPGGSIAPA